ncbi:MAG TPA: aromatic ring-hydroxylating dioxygenase subunit alpha [Acidobacteriota bacterium]|nr:aromatic ring-hydroxylating dioxygenase subunit alpha [Acidobacteriota bacterium]
MGKQSGFKRRGVDYRVPDQMATLPRRYFQSPSVFQQEMERIFRRRWILACRDEEIPDPGDFLTLEAAEESILLVRDEEGRLRAHFNVCRHRGTRLCGQERGHFAKGRIECPYHAWKYGLSGRLKAAPLMKDAVGFRKEDYGLFSASLALWGGFVFLNLSDEPRPFDEEMSALCGRFQSWNLPRLRIAHKIAYDLECNWKLILQNYQECYHCPGVHPRLAGLTPFRSAVHDCMQGPVVGGYMELSRERGSLTMDGEAAGPPLAEVSGDDLGRVYYYSVFPNFLLSPHPDFVLCHRLRPLDFNRTLVDCFFLLEPGSIADSGRMQRFRSAIEFWDQTNRQDWEVCQQMQQGLRSRRFERGRYSPQEDICYALDREVLRALGHPHPDED